jgi:activator of 2-hydroxyglutaryl-CoA dehydratase
MIVADCGSTWTKILNTGDGSLSIIQTSEMSGPGPESFDIATGHSAAGRCGEFRNELIALTAGARKMIGKPDFTVVDVGGRDIKLISMNSGRISKMDWNLACGSSTGATIELLGRYYGIDFSSLRGSDRWINVTCGVFGMEKVLEHVSKGGEPSEGVARFIHGLVRNVHDFAGRPEQLYLSGGFCENNCFVETMERYCDLTLLGRAVLIEGLIEELENRNKESDI